MSNNTDNDDHKDIEPVKSKDIEPVKSKDIEPVKSKDIEPVDNQATDNKILKDEGIINKITLNAEKFDISKETEQTQLHLEKKWTETTKKIEIPIKHEQLYINGKDFDSYNENEILEAFSKIKDKISEVFHHHEGNKDLEHNYEKDGQIHNHHDLDIKQVEKTNSNHNKDDEKQHILEERSVPLFDTNNDNTNRDIKDEETIPIWGEEIIINKKIVKIGEITIKKYQVTEKQNIEVDLRKEKLTVKYPDNIKEEIT